MKSLELVEIVRLLENNSDIKGKISTMNVINTYFELDSKIFIYMWCVYNLSDIFCFLF